MSAKAVCVLVTETSTSSGITGVLTLTQNSETDPTVIAGEVKGLAPGSVHGLSLNIYGDLSDGATSCGDVFNPFNGTHGLPGDPSRRVGSLGNVTAGADGRADVQITDELVKLIGPHSVVGRSLVIYASQDDGGRGGHVQSSETGNAGPRAAAGVIGLAAMT
uniref:Superoxide dismutase copper/zinc binding domain-containing protein n=1 Tax=Thalassionema nitzschioides TaxID=33649 RepID=A0A6T5XRA2_9STRA|mmetsp:Transcript_27587/g.40740  ORF Transcript_27587/g.40740 Transcript_27587/m.40740 type:complete len:162 (+) Transcript_27587:125-610(+)|eukprot:CAMPEP_0194202852 /NCGR_PEP_ID=MMETSP0156-20130528/2774_1 /TAXON_ID=33649 /ORGANISM="Thalassionema nitzschioides, Strain L26-B" /LENGTH=161 /DNA_ID=CAMNT_0038928457 /DNA_START=114 /DNA_END=599 /DNA_ORIENTATION=-